MSNSVTANKPARIVPLTKNLKEIVSKSSKTSTYQSEYEQLRFDYDQLKDKAIISWLKNQTIEVRRTYRKTVVATAAMGNVLIEAKERLPHGYFMEWLTEEFVNSGYFNVITANNAMRVAYAVKKYGMDKLENIPVSILYMSASGNEPDEFIEHIIESYEEYKWTAREAKKEKKRYKELKENEKANNLSPEQSKVLLKSNLTLEETKTVLKLPPQDLTKTIETLVQHNTSNEDTITPEVLPSDKQVHKIPYNGLDYPTDLTSKTYSFAMVQGNVNREDMSDITAHLNKVKELTDHVAIAVELMTIMTIKPIEGFYLSKLITVHRTQKKIINEIGMISYLYGILVFSKVGSKKTRQRPIEDYYPSFELAMGHLVERYALDKDILIMRASDECDYELFDNTLISKYERENNLTLYY